MGIFSNELRISALSIMMFGLLVFNSCQKDLEDIQPTAMEFGKAAAPAVDPKVALGELLYQDKNLSMDDDYNYVDGSAVLVQSCQSCHSPQQGFAGMDTYSGDGSFKDVTDGVFGLSAYMREFRKGFAEGATKGKFGGRIPPTSAYAAFSPVLQTKTIQLTNNGNAEVEFFGGNFWDGRATGKRLGSPAAEQALGPFNSGVEMNVHGAITGGTGVDDRLEVLKRIGRRLDTYYKVVTTTGTTNAWALAYGAFPITESTTESSETLINDTYDKIGLAIAAFEGSTKVSPFTSSYDQYVATKTGPLANDPQALAGLTLFSNAINNTLKGKKGAGCFGCHAINNTFNTQKVFTDYGYDNIGVPAVKDANGNTMNQDLGLGAFLASLPAGDPWNNIDFIAKNAGTFKTPTLRNVGKGEIPYGSNATGVGRRYMHNGVFNSLEQVVHFYNTRDLPIALFPNAGWPVNPVDGSAIPGVTRPWGSPDYSITMKTGGEVGNLKLTWAEEKQLVAFMRHLTDGVWKK